MALIPRSAEKVAQWAKGAKVFKSFNQTGWENMADPIYEGKATAMLVCGDDEVDKKTVLQLVSDIGFEAVDAGKLEVARLIEPFGMTWIHLAMKQGLGRDWRATLRAINARVVGITNSSSLRKYSTVIHKLGDRYAIS